VSGRLTPQQAATLEAILRWRAEWHVAPSRRELVSMAGLASTRTAHALLERMAEAGLLRVVPRMARSAVVTDMGRRALARYRARRAA
jgi:SOS-response transcriptional repressor LexA